MTMTPSRTKMMAPIGTATFKFNLTSCVGVRKRLGCFLYSFYATPTWGFRRSDTRSCFCVLVSEFVPCLVEAVLQEI